MKKIIFTFLLVIVCFSPTIFAQIPVKTLVQISRAEDELRFDKTLEDLMKNANAEHSQTRRTCRRTHRKRSGDSDTNQSFGK